MCLDALTTTQSEVFRALDVNVTWPKHTKHAAGFTPLEERRKVEWAFHSIRWRLRNAHLHLRHSNIRVEFFQEVAVSQDMCPAAWRLQPY